ncbi:MAG: BMP family protein [Lactobacillaceae bacterium]|jgi:basic membrane protein A|nr:BMP family protein [Lactobacillaceae bacterium]
MRSTKIFALTAAALLTAGTVLTSSTELALAAKKYKTSVALVTDQSGIDDKSFNQSAWEGLQKWGKKNGVKQGKGGYTYYSAKSTADYATEMNQAVADGFKNVFAIGFTFTSDINTAAKKSPKTHFILVDDVAKARKNVASVEFKSEQSSYLAGVAAAKTTKTNKVGFVGGQKSAVLDMFEAGYVAGVKSVNKNIKVSIQYTGDFTDAGKAKSIAASMYTSGADVIFQAAGSAGNGVFTEAKDLNKGKKKAAKVWVIGVDRDQNKEGAYTAKNGKSNFTLTSATKGVGTVVAKVSTLDAKGKFPGGKTLTYGLKDKGVAVTRGHMSAAAWKAIKDARQAIIDGKVTVPAAPAK